MSSSKLAFFKKLNSNDIDNCNKLNNYNNIKYSKIKNRNKGNSFFQQKASIICIISDKSRNNFNKINNNEQQSKFNNEFNYNWNNINRNKQCICQNVLFDILHQYFCGRKYTEENYYNNTIGSRRSNLFNKNIYDFKKNKKCFRHPLKIEKSIDYEYYPRKRCLSNINNYKNYNDFSLQKRKGKNIIICKSSERNEKIKSFPKGKKYEPLVVKKVVQKPIVEKIKKEDGTLTNVMRQTTVITSIETKPIKNKKSDNENIVKECITNIYTTLTKNIDESDTKSLTKNKSDDNFKLKNKNNIKNGNKVFIKRKIADNLNINKKLNNYKKLNHKNQHNINKNEIDNFNKYNNNINITEISNDLLKNKTSESSINNSSLISYEEIDPNNRAVRINEEIKYIKYLYYRCTKLNSEHKAKVKSLTDYFLKLSDEEKICILNKLNAGKKENKKIYQKLKNILREKEKEGDCSINDDNNNIFDKNIISDYEEEEDMNIKKVNVSFKKDNFK